MGCELCKIVVRLVDEIAGQNASIDTVNTTLKEICERLAGDQLIQIVSDAEIILRMPSHICQVCNFSAVMKTFID